MTERERIETAIGREDGVLTRIVQLLTARTAFSTWPTEDLVLLQRAVSDDANAIEAGKGRVLMRHLFRASPTPWAALGRAPTTEERRMVERLRADLAGLVPLGAGNACWKSEDQGKNVSTHR